MNRTLALLVSLPLLLGVLAAPAQARAGNPSATYSAAAHGATNKARDRFGLVALSKSSCLKTYAANQAAVMAAAHLLSHQDLGPVLAGCGLTGAGENVALGFSGGKSVVKAWMASPGHRRNILKKNFRQEAVAAVRGTDGIWYVAQVFGS